MSSTKKTVILALAVSLVLACIVLFFVLQQWPVSASEAVSAYTLKEWKGQVAVFEKDQAYPMQVFDVYVSTLPAEEQEKIKNGISAQGEEELWVLLEDYTS